MVGTKRPAPKPKDCYKLADVWVSDITPHDATNTFKVKVHYWFRCECHEGGHAFGGSVEKFQGGPALHWTVVAWEGKLCGEECSCDAPDWNGSMEIFIPMDDDNESCGRASDLCLQSLSAIDDRRLWTVAYEECMEKERIARGWTEEEWRICREHWKWGVLRDFDATSVSTLQILFNRFKCCFP